MPKKSVIKKTAMAPTAVIAGGAGFIGSHIAETLLKKKARVVVLDNFSTGKDIYISPFLGNPNFALFDIDINTGLPEQLESADYIFHIAGLEEYLYNKEELNLDSLLTNGVGTKNLLDFTNKAEGKFLLVSSIDVYQGLISPLSLDHYFGPTPAEERKYSLTEAKRFAEALVWEYYTKHQTDVRIVRLPEIFGPKMNLGASGSLGQLVSLLIDNKDMMIYGEGTQKEYYLYIEDAVSGIIKALFSDNTKGNVFSLVGRDSYTPLEIAYLLKNLANKEVQIVHKPSTKDVRIYTKKVDTTNNSLIKWEDKTNFKEGVITTLKWFGYDVNTNSFKPAKLIENKKLEKQELITSLGTENPDKDKYLRKFLKKDVVSKNTTDEEKVDVIFEQKPSQDTKQETAKNDFAKKPFVENKNTKNTDNRQKPSKMFNVALGLVAAWLAFVMIFIFLPSAQTAFFAHQAQRNALNMEKGVKSLDITTAKNASDEAFKNLNRTKTSLANLKWLFVATKKGSTYEAIQSTLSSAGYSAKAAYFATKSSEPFEDIFEVLRSDSDKILSDQDFSEAANNIIKAQENLDLALAELNTVEKNLLPDFMLKEFEAYETRLRKAQREVGDLVVLSRHASQILGIERPVSYLILFQNSNEIRPTGGFIGSYAVLQLENSKITSLTIDDVYNPDGQIDIRNIQVEPPEPISFYLNENRLHIRNANWNPDFPQSAQTVKDLFYRLGGTSFDGVLAIDLKMAQSLLEITGPVFLTAYNEEITADNMFEKTQFYSEFNYENGSDQKRSFLTTLGSKLLEKIFSLEKSQVPELLATIRTRLEEKNMLIYINDEQINAILGDKNWNGKLISPEKDFLYIVNANVGGTKANYYIKNDYNYEVSSLTRDGVLRADLEMNYKHTGESNAWPGGPYTNYVRVLTAEGTKLTGAKITSNGIETDIFDEVATQNSGSYTVFATSFKVEPGNELTLKLSYDLPETASITKDNRDYSLYWQKQPGTSDSFNFLFAPPFALKINGLEKFSAQGTLSTDKMFDLKLD